MKHDNNKKLQILDETDEQHKHRNPYGNPFHEEVQNPMPTPAPISVSQSYHVAPKPPKHDPKLISTHDPKMLVEVIDSKKQSSQNDSKSNNFRDMHNMMIPKENIDPNSGLPQSSTQSYHANPYRPGSARAPLFEFSNTVHQMNSTDARLTSDGSISSSMNTKNMIKEKNRKHRKTQNKSRVDDNSRDVRMELNRSNEKIKSTNHNEIPHSSIMSYTDSHKRPYQNYSYNHENNTDSESMKSGDTAIHLGSKHDEIMIKQEQTDEQLKYSDRPEHIHSPDFGKPNETPVSGYLPSHLSNLSAKFNKADAAFNESVSLDILNNISNHFESGSDSKLRHNSRVRKTCKAK